MSIVNLWEIPGVGRYRCYARTLKFARQRLRFTKEAVLVKYLGQKTAGNRDPQRSDFILTVDEKQDFTIDPTWYAYVPPAPPAAPPPPVIP